uniref:3-hydroxybenzoate 6-hydroxylase 1 n=1 Tax=Aegilops tauschii TaxID=37682 RepID=M8AVJ2_AEGTA
MAAGIQQQDAAEDIVIAGAGLAGLAVALGLHRKGVRSVVLESSPERRTSGFAFFTWTNAFRALDALGVGDKMRGRHLQLQGLRVMTSSTGEIAREMDLRVNGKLGPHEVRCVQRNVLLQALEEELPPGTVRYSSKIVSIDDQDGAKILHIADGSTLRAKVLIGCDGINSVVAKWLGLAKPSESGRTATRGYAKYPEGHGFEPKILQFVGEGFRAGLVPWSDTDVYWFFTWSPAPSPDANGKDDDAVDRSAAAMKQFVLTKMTGAKVSPEVLEAVERSEMSDVLAAPLRFRSPLSLLFASISKGNVARARRPRRGVDRSAAAMKQFVLTKMTGAKVSPEVLEAVERSEMSDVLAAPLRFRSPLSLLFASISKGNVCVAGDALHPTTPDLAQGACTALEDGVVLARCLGDAIVGAGSGEAEGEGRGCPAQCVVGGSWEQKERVVAALRRYAGIRRWRSAQVIAVSYAVGFVQESDHSVVSFVRDMLLSGVLAKTLLMMPDYDCGKL